MFIDNDIYTANGAGCGIPSLVGLISDDGWVKMGSSLGSTTDTLSGKGFFGPILPLGSQGNIILTLIPSTPKIQEQPDLVSISKPHIKLFTQLDIFFQVNST